VTFSDIAAHYVQEELTEDQNQASVPKAHSTTATYRRYLRKWVLPRWGDQAALTIQPLDLENWLKELGKRNGLENQTRSKIRQVIGLVYKHAQRVGFLPRTEQANPIRFVRQSTASNFEPTLFDSSSGLRHHQPTGADAAYAGSGHSGHCPSDLRDSSAAVERHRRRKSMHLRSSSLRLWKIRQTQVESLKTSRSATPCSSREVRMAGKAASKRDVHQRE
jgi:hypothetical protein